MSAKSPDGSSSTNGSLTVDAAVTSPSGTSNCLRRSRHFAVRTGSLFASAACKLSRTASMSVSSILSRLSPAARVRSQSFEACAQLLYLRVHGTYSFIFRKLSYKLVEQLQLFIRIGYKIDQIQELRLRCDLSHEGIFPLAGKR